MELIRKYGLLISVRKLLLVFSARLSTTHNAEITMEVRLDGLDGQVLAKIKVPRTGGSDRWRMMEEQIPQVTGVHDLYFIFKGKAPKDLAYFDYWKLNY